jgi:hypothetical protein
LSRQVGVDAARRLRWVNASRRMKGLLVEFAASRRK